MAAAAEGLVWATLLMCVALGAGERPVENPFFPPGSEPEPVRIYCQENAALNVAERDGNVVLAYGNCSDLRQKWFVVTSPHPSAPFELPPPFALQNAQTFQVIIIPSGSGQKVRLSSEPPINPLDWLSWSRAGLEQRWTPEKSTRADHFYQLFVTKSDPALTLNGLLGNVHDGTDVGIFSAEPTSGNAIWQMTSYPLCAR